MLRNAKRNSLPGAKGGKERSGVEQGKAGLELDAEGELALAGGVSLP